MTPFLQAAFAVYRKDLRAEFRSRELLSAMGLFALLSVLVFSFGLELVNPLLAVNQQLRDVNLLLESLGQPTIAPTDPLNLSDIVNGTLYVTLIFAVILGLNRSLANEREQGSLDALLLAPVDRSAIFIGKALANFTFASIVGLLLMPVISILFNLNMLQPALIGLMVLTALGLATIGTLLATITVQTRSSETLLPIIMLPTAIPLLLAAIRAANGILNGVPVEFWAGWPPALIVVNVIYLVLCYLLFPYVIEE